MKIIKWFFITLLVLVLLLAGTVYVLITFYKKDLTAMLMEELKTKHGLLLEAGKVKVSFLDNWPHASVELKDVVIQSNLNAGKSEPLISAGVVALSFNLERMLHGEFIVKYVAIKDADITLVKNADGSKNFVFKKQDSLQPKPRMTSVPESTAGIRFEVNRISIKDSRFRYINRQREQDIDIQLTDVKFRLKHFSDGVQAHMDGDVHVTGLMFNAKKGPFLPEKDAELNLDLIFYKDTKSICILPPSYLTVDKQDYQVTTLIEFGNRKRLAMFIEGKKVDFATTVTLLTARIRNMLSNFDVKNPVSAKILLVVNIGQREEPVIILDVAGAQNSLTIGNSKIPYSDVSFTGRIVSMDPSRQRGDMENAEIVFSPIKGKLYDFPFTATVKVVSLTNPYIWITGNLLVEGPKINFTVAKDFILRGTTVVKLKYSGPTEKLNSREFLEKPMKLNATLIFKDMSYKEINRSYTYIVNGRATLNNKDLQFDDLNVKSIVGEAVLKGKAENFVNYVLGYSTGFKANLAARTEFLNLNPLFEKSEEPAPSEQDKDKSSDIVDGINKEEPSKMSTSKFEFNVQLFAKKMLIRKVEAQMANADLFYKNDFLNVKTINLSTCDGKIYATGTLQDFNKLRADMTMVNVNVNKLFKQFDNFGQETIVSDNLKGVLSLDAKFRTDLDPKKSIIGETMVGEVRLKLRDGHLVNFEPVQNLSNFLFKNRDFNDVAFSELSETFQLEGYKMRINELEIASNVLDLFVVDGLYDFKGKSNINILVPWSNLKRRGKNYVPKNSGQSAENTRGLKLNFQGPSKKMKLSLGHKAL